MEFSGDHFSINKYLKKKSHFNPKLIIEKRKRYDYDVFLGKGRGLYQNNNDLWRT